MIEDGKAAVRCLQRAVASLEPRCLRGQDAARLVEVFAEAERLAAAGKAIAARRVEETNAWRAGGHRSAADWLAGATGSSVGAAAGALETARRLEGLPATAEAHRSGRLSETQAREIASAAAANPAAEADLLAAADRQGMGGLRERCRAAKAAGGADEATRHRALHRSRHLRHWSDADGAFRMDMRTTPDAGATIVAALKPFDDQVFTEARRTGRREPAQAYAADALVALAQAASAGRVAAAGEAGDWEAGGGHGPASQGGGPSAMVHVRVDHAALVRGHVEGGETCEIPGVGPIPVATARAMAADAILKVLVTDGVDVVAVAHGGRTVTAHQRSALCERDRTCVVEGCDVRDRLEIDHVDGWAVTRTTTLERLARLCRWHHHLKTYCGYRLNGRPGHWRLMPPDQSALDPSAPDQSAPAASAEHAPPSRDAQPVLDVEAPLFAPARGRARRASPGNPASPSPSTSP